MIAITSDIDWAPEELIYQTIKIFEEYQVKCTFFCTHFSEAIQNCNKKLFEIAIHPNFNTNLFDNKGESPSKKIDELLHYFPMAKGIRTHGLLTSPSLSDLFSKKGLNYESNYLIPYSDKIELFKLWNGIVCLPINWEDNIHFYYGYPFDDLKIDIDSNKVNILNFHPIHIFLNTESEETYNNSKNEYQNQIK